METKTNYYNKNKEYHIEHLNNMNSKITCKVCGKQFTKGNKANHIKTKYHQKSLKEEGIPSKEYLKRKQKIIHQYEVKLLEFTEELIKEKGREIKKLDIEYSADSSDERPKKIRNKK
jgi:hypothetical protein